MSPTKKGKAQNSEPQEHQRHAVHELWWPPMSQLTPGMQRVNLVEYIQDDSQSGNQSDDWGYCFDPRIYVGFEKETQKLLVEHIKESCAEQDCPIAVYTWGNPTEGRETLRIRLKCPHDKSKGCPFSFQLCFDSNEKYWYLKRGTGKLVHEGHKIPNTTAAAKANKRKGSPDHQKTMVLDPPVHGRHQPMDRALARFGGCACAAGCAMGSPPAHYLSESLTLSSAPPGRPSPMTQRAWTAPALNTCTHQQIQTLQSPCCGPPLHRPAQHTDRPEDAMAIFFHWQQQEDPRGFHESSHTTSDPQPPRAAPFHLGQQKCLAGLPNPKGPEHGPSNRKRPENCPPRNSKHLQDIHGEISATKAVAAPEFPSVPPPPYHSGDQNSLADLPDPTLPQQSPSRKRPENRPPHKTRRLLEAQRSEESIWCSELPGCLRREEKQLSAEPILHSEAPSGGARLLYTQSSEDRGSKFLRASCQQEKLSRTELPDHTETESCPPSHRTCASDGRLSDLSLLLRVFSEHEENKKRGVALLDTELQKHGWPSRSGSGSSATEAFPSEETSSPKLRARQAWPQRQSAECGLLPEHTPPPPPLYRRPDLSCGDLFFSSGTLHLSDLSFGDSMMEDLRVGLPSRGHALFSSVGSLGDG